MRKSEQSCCRRRRGGFSLIEILIVLIIGIVLTAVAIPGLSSLLKTFRTSGDAQDISGAVSVAKMRAAANFTRARVFADRGANQFRVETWTLLSGQTSNCWVADGDSHCTDSYSGSSAPPQNALARGVTFGYGSLATSPLGGAIAQAPGCQTTAQTIADDAGTISNSACIVFNSRAVPVDPIGAATTANLYVTEWQLCLWRDGERARIDSDLAQRRVGSHVEGPVKGI